MTDVPMAADTLVDAPSPARELRPSRRRPTAAPAPFDEPRPWTPERFGGAVELALLVVGGAFLLTYVVIALLRIGYPYELEWIEGGFVDLVQRVQEGRSLYNAPTLESIPYIYTPLYYWVSAGVASVVGIGFVPLRLVSLVSSLLAFAFIYRLVERETGDRRAGFLAACLFAACFRISGAWFDLARVDSMMMALLLGGLLLARFARHWWTVAVAAVVLVAAFQTKQAALLPALGVVPFLFHRNRRWLAVYVATFAAALVGSVAAINSATDGWYAFYVFELPASHELVPELWTGFWTIDILRNLGVAVAVTAACLLPMLVGRERWNGDWLWFHLPVAGGAMATAYSSRLHSGGYDNVLLPAFGVIAVGFGLGWHALKTMRPDGGSTRAAARRWMWPVVGVLCVAQFAVLAYDPTAQVPTRADVRLGDRMIEELRALPGSIFLPGHGWYLSKIGRPTTAQGSAMADIRRGRVDGTHLTLSQEIRGAIADRRYDYVIVDSNSAYSYLPGNFRCIYVAARPLAYRKRALMPLTGTMTGPFWVWVPREVPLSYADCNNVQGGRIPI